jgi:NAD(P)-dependent dehydrogenase (short-subunit alcohol dehydrogenase family)
MYRIGLEGKRALVTGAFGGLGRHFALTLARAGASVGLVGRRLAAGEAQALARHMRDSGRRGSIVNIASITGLRVAGAISAYVAAKAGLIQLTKAMALELARYGIRVNALAPGYIETDMNRDFFAAEAGQALIRRIPQRRIGQPQELDGPLLLLASDASSYMTGSVLAVDGGHLVSSL